ncbi:FAD-dependent oxidoreductase [Tistrella mobilis]|uniref:NAD(P)/FAD-dependent oxidoreductase n=1 Tax=Tistrella mobilis TaxID=171437 RepID=UPI003557F185
MTSAPPPAFEEPIGLAIIGAGLAGISAGRLARRQGVTPLIFDKGHGIGGRLATRRVTLDDGTVLRFDHGAQFMTARSPALVAAMAGAEAANLARRLPAPPLNGPSLHGQPPAPERDQSRWVGQPHWVGMGGMTAIAKHLAQGLDIRTGTRVGGVVRTDRGLWRLEDEDGLPLVQARRLIVTAPPEQTLDLLIDVLLPEGWRRRIASTIVAPCWALMLAVDEALPLPGPRWRPEDEAIAWIGDQTALPGRAAGPQSLVVHATPHWSRIHLEETPEVAAASLLRELERLIGRAITPRLIQAHRWRYALAEVPLGSPCLADPGTGIAIAGDWCIGGRAEAAVDSGRAAALALIG